MKATPLDDGRDRDTHLGIIHPDAPPLGAGLLPVGEDAAFLQRWEALQVRFADEPRSTVERADALVAEVRERLAEGFAASRERLEEQWAVGEELSADDLRVARRRYQAFFQRLLFP